jgi:hypothetical protein
MPGGVAGAQLIMAAPYADSAKPAGVKKGLPQLGRPFFWFNAF